MMMKSPVSIPVCSGVSMFDQHAYSSFVFQSSGSCRCTTAKAPGQHERGSPSLMTPTWTNHTWLWRHNRTRLFGLACLGPLRAELTLRVCVCVCVCVTCMWVSVCVSRDVCVYVRAWMYEQVCLYLVPCCEHRVWCPT